MSNICYECVHLRSLKDFISQKNISGLCNFCNKSNKICKWDEFENHIKSFIEKLYFQNQDMGNLFIRHVLNDMAFKAHSDVKTKLIKNNHKNRYLRRQDADINSIPKDVFLLSVLWEKLKVYIQQECRFFIKDYRILNGSQSEKASFFFDKIKDLMNDFSQEINITKEMPVGESIFRARVDKNIDEYNAKTLGSPPYTVLPKSTRLSPVGIPVFYGSSTEKTAMKEIKGEAVKFVVGQWVVKKKILYMDLTELDNLDLPDYFSHKSFRKRELIEFLKRINSSLSERIEKDGKENISYIPTQLISEFFKLSYKDIMGIKYNSSLSKNGVNYAFFQERMCMTDSIGSINLDREERGVIMLSNYKNRNLSCSS